MKNYTQHTNSQVLHSSETVVETPVLAMAFDTFILSSAGNNIPIKEMESPVWRCSDCFEEFYYYPLVCDCGCPDFVEGI